MSRKGIIGIGPALLFVNFFALLASAATIITTLGLVSGIVLNKKIRKIPLSTLVPRIIVFITLTILIITAVHLIGGPTSPHYLGMGVGAVVFFIISTALSINSIKQDAKSAWLSIGILTLLFLFIAETSVYLALR